MKLTNSKMEEILKLGDEISSFKLCSPSDDPDLQTAVIYGFKNLVKKMNFQKIFLKQDLYDASKTILLDKKHLNNNPKNVKQKDIISLLKKINEGQIFV